MEGSLPTSPEAVGKRTKKKERRKTERKGREGKREREKGINSE